jgi:4a-hydroxytetrahydrobiopterin dehydratase
VNLSGQEVSTAVGGSGWRYVLSVLRASVPVDSLAHAVDVVSKVAVGAGDSLSLDVRSDRVVLTLRSPDADVTSHEIELAQRIAGILGELGLRFEPESAQLLEIAIDALDIDLVRPFWKAVLAYSDGSGRELVDPRGTSPAVWFQQMTEPRPQRNRIHVDVSVPHDEAPHRIQAALDAGGVLLSDTSAPAFWVLADVEGNEACVSTWQGRD